MEYTERIYRRQFRQDDLTYFQVVVKETDLGVAVRRERFDPALANWVEEMVREQRALLEGYIKSDPAFAYTFAPFQPRRGAPEMAVRMAEAAALAGVGPMAAVAGAFAECVGKRLSRRSKDVIVENGGDIYVRSTRLRRIGVFAGDSVLSNRVGLEIKPEDTPLGICTSSGSVGHSTSLGKADAAVVLSDSVPLADAVATAAANMVADKDDLQRAVDYALNVEGVRGALVILEDRLAAAGQLKIIPL